MAITAAVVGVAVAAGSTAYSVSENKKAVAKQEEATAKQEQAIAKNEQDRKVQEQAVTQQAFSRAQKSRITGKPNVGGIGDVAAPTAAVAPRTTIGA